MKCPLFVAGNNAQPVLNEIGPEDCIKEKCAWWDTAYGMCIERSKARLLDGILMDLKQIREKMPHAGQFTK